MDDLTHLTIAEQRQLLDTRQVSPLELVDAALARIERVQPLVNCFVEVWAEEARRRAGATLAGPLSGIPVAIKDTTPWAGHRVTFGSRTNASNLATTTARLVDQLLGAGAIVIGSTNTPEFAHAGITDNRLHGATRNPFSLDRTTGGSSGGSAAAVASGCVAVAEGSDMGGSVRIPSAWCGLVGLKPSLGRIPMDVLPGLFDLISHHGPLARSVDDAIRFVRCVEGPSLRDPYSWHAPLSDRAPDLAGRRVGLSVDLDCWSVDDQIAASVVAAAGELTAHGMVVSEVHPRITPRDNHLWLELWGIFMAAYYGHLVPDRSDELDPDVVSLVELGRSFSAVDAKRMEIERSDFWRRIATVLEDHDVIVCPTMSQPPGPAAKDSNRRRVFVDERGAFHSEDMTSVWNLASPCPAISVPCGRHTGADAGLPIGLQIIGRPGHDALVFEIARVIESKVGAPSWRAID